jgi:hypothetical protein
MFIPAELLPRLQFVREGQFVEKMGAPTLKLIGEAQIAASPPGAMPSGPKEISTRIIQVPTQISSVDIIKGFLTQEKVTDPKQWLLAICSEPSPYFPVHFYRRQARMSSGETIRFFEAAGARSQSRKPLIKRLRDGTKFKPSTTKGTGDASLVRGEMLKKLEAGTITAADITEHLDRVLEAILHLKAGSIQLKPVSDLLLQILPTYGSMGTSQAGRFRTAIAYLDETWFGKDTDVS